MARARGPGGGGGMPPGLCPRTSGFFSQERLTRGTLNSTMCRAAHPSGCARCKADAGCSAVSRQSLSPRTPGSCRGLDTHPSILERKKNPGSPDWPDQLDGVTALSVSMLSANPRRLPHLHRLRSALDFRPGSGQQRCNGSVVLTRSFSNIVTVVAVAL